MDAYLCPDCHVLHDEPAEPVLGHVARCPTCEIDAELALAAAVVTLPLPAAPPEMQPAA